MTSSLVIYVSLGYSNNASECSSKTNGVTGESEAEDLGDSADGNRGGEQVVAGHNQATTLILLQQ